ncbi:MAG: SPOR domain-containing protein [Epsilonproteobacteria bacterium]|nr:SPOR domain-containing protein [Campylobacterota bacterium]
MQEELLNPEPKKEIKKPLIYGAVGFLAFIVIVIAVALYQNSKNKENGVDEIIPPETTAQNQQSEFKPIEVQEPKINTKKLAMNEEKPQKQTNIKPQEIQVQEPEKTIQPAAAPAPKEEAKTEVKPTKPASKPKNNDHNTVLKGEYYIQVAALLRNAKPSPKFLALIKKSGFDYTLFKTCFKKNGEEIKVTKVLVGPFKDRKEAMEAMKKIKANITQNAFIFRVKK